MSLTDELLSNNEAYAASFDKGELPMPPGKQIAVLEGHTGEVNSVAFSPDGGRLATASGQPCRSAARSPTRASTCAA